MIFVHALQIMNPKTNSTEEKNVVFAIAEDQVSFTPSALINKIELFNYCKKYNIKLAKTQEYAMPLIFTYATADVLNCSSFINVFFKTLDQYGLAKDVIERLKESFLPQLQNMLKDDKIAAIIFDSAVAQYMYLKKSSCGSIESFGVDDIDPDFLEDTQNFIQSLDVAKTTVSLFQKECTDKLSLRLPTRGQLSDDSIELADLIPKRSEICVPYQNPLAYTSQYNKAGLGVPSSLYPLIEGDAKNNTLPIQENEQEFYDALVKWIQTNIAEDSTVIAGENGITPIDDLSETYLTELLNTIYSWHWGHNSNVPTIQPEESELDENGDSSTNTDGMSKYVYTVERGEEFNLHVPAFVPLYYFMTDACKKLGYKVWAEAIVKMCRWGTRKPTALYFEGYPFIFDLGKNATIAYAGSILDYEIAYNQNGCNYVPQFAFMDATTIVDTKFITDRDYSYNRLVAPVGIVFSSVYSNKKNDKKLQTNKYLSIVDVIRLLILEKSGINTGYKFDGISLEDNGTIKLNAALSIDSNTSSAKLLMKYHDEKSTLLENPFYVSQPLNDVFMELKSYDSNKDINQFTILSNGMQTAELEATLEENSFSTLDELAQKYSEFVITNKETAISLNVFRIIFDIYLEVSKRIVDLKKAGKDATLEDVFNLYLDVMIEQEYDGESSFLQNVKGEEHSIMEAYKASFPQRVAAKEEPEKEDGLDIVPEPTKEQVESATSDYSGPVIHHAENSNTLERATMFDSKPEESKENGLESVPEPTNEQMEKVAKEVVKEKPITEHTVAEQPVKEVIKEVPKEVVKMVYPSFTKKIGKLHNVNRIKVDDTTIGYFSRITLSSGDKAYIIVADDYVTRNPDVNIGPVTFPASIFTAIAIEAIAKLQIHDTSNLKLYFEDDVAIEKFAKALEVAAVKEYNEKYKGKE